MFYSILFSIIIIIFLIVEQSTVWCLAENKNATFGCVPNEKNALLRFKASMTFDPSNKLSSWNTNYDDCCTWQGVECDKATGHVIGLHLRNNSLNAKTVDSSLMTLEYLSYLDLSFNDFQGSSIPMFLGSMKQMQHLSLSYANFAGIIPHQLGNLSSLRTLDIRGSFLFDDLIVEDLTWVINLSSLEYLDLSGVNLNRTKDLIKVLIMLPSIVDLQLSGSGLVNTNILPHTCLLNSTLLANNNNVQYLDLSSNSFDGEFPCFLQNMTSLTYLDLSNNHYKSIGPHFLTSNKNLSHLNLSFNSLKYGSDWISDLCQLKSLDLTNNQFYGYISGAFKNTSGCWSHNNLEILRLAGNNFEGQLPEELGELKQLTELYLAGNQLSGEIPISIGHLSNLVLINITNNKFSGPIPASLGNLTTLRVLDVSRNQLSGKIPIFLGQQRLLNVDVINIFDNKISGPIPASLGNLTTLRFLDLSRNQLSGEVPITLGQLSNMEWGYIFSNSLEGTLSEAHFANLSKLHNLGVEYNNMLKLRVGHDWVPPFQLRQLWIRSTDLGGQFPQWLQTQKALIGFDLSDCNIAGMLPEWLKSMSLQVLYLPRNHIEGPIPELPSSLRVLDLSYNMITNNFPSNTIPLDLEYLRLAGNFINGSIPDSLCEMKALGTLDLSENQLSGVIPDCLWNFKSLDIVRLSSNRLSGAIPNSIGGAYSLRWLHLDNNNFTGQIPSTLKNCTMLAVLDVGDNKLSGKLPEWIGDHLLNLVVLRLRNNEFYGVIPSTYCQPSRLQIMDLANNNLTGNIPRCFGNFTRMVEGANHSEIYGSDGGDYGGWFYESLNEVMKGVMRKFTKTMRYFTNLDLSSNHLAGEIPSELTNLTGLICLNLSHNHLGGKIPGNVGDMKSLESLDLSSNTLSGTISQSLSKLNFITHLDLSNNNLSGQIPTGPQLRTLDNTSNYGGNPGLCGPPLQKKCHINETPPNDAKDGDAPEKFYLSAFIISGVATGFWGYFGVLVFKRSWRLALFRCMNVVIGKILGRH